MEPKQKVFVKSISQEGEIIEILKNGLYRIRVGNLQFDRPEKDLKPIDGKAWEKYKKVITRKEVPKLDPVEKAALERPIDLHGMRVEEAIKALTQKLDDALTNDLDRVAVIHGLGTGALLTAVHAFLKKQPYVKRFELEMGNPGTTWVYL